jgi:hypothetical protein
MKVRIKQNSLRFRITEKEAEQLKKSKAVEVSCIIFHGVELVFRISPSKDQLSEMIWNAPEVELHIPDFEMQTFLSSNKESWHKEFTIDGKLLLLSVEKDLAYFRNGFQA